MSFYSYKNANPNCCPGTISGSALDGLQEKVCVQVKRVYDSAMTQEQLTKQTVTITSYAQVNNTCTCNACGCHMTDNNKKQIQKNVDHTCDGKVDQWSFRIAYGT